MNRNFGRITVVTVTGLVAGCEEAAHALSHSHAQMEGSQALMCSPWRPANLPDTVRHVPIAPMGYLEYSLFMVYALHHFIETEYVLIVQGDGWVLDVNNWDDRFLEFDYLGAPTHVAYRFGQDQSVIYYDNYSWVPQYIAGEQDIYIAFNGGFSLRSHRLLQAPQSLAINYIYPSNMVLTTVPHQMQWPGHLPNEDVQLCTLMRPRLESAGMRFPDVPTACLFAAEYVPAELYDSGRMLANVFGHHGKHRKLVHSASRSNVRGVVNYLGTESQASSMWCELSMIEHLRKLGYEVNFEPC